MFRNAFAVVIFLACVVTQALAAVYMASTWAPDFFRRRVATSPEELIATAQSFEDELARLHADAHDQDGRWTASVSDAQINSWLLANMPKRFPKALPSTLRDPRIALEDRKCHIACQYADGGTQAVLTMTIDVLPTGKPNQVKLRILSANIGSVGGLQSQAIDMMSYAAARARFPMRWISRDEHPEAIVYVPRNWLEQDLRVQVDRITLGDRRVSISGRSISRTPRVRLPRNGGPLAAAIRDD